VRFKFKNTVEEEASQAEFSREVMQKLDFSLMVNQTIFAYGQTGSGKTHSIFGTAWLRSYQEILNKTDEEIMAAIEADQHSYGLIQRVLCRVCRELDANDARVNGRLSVFQIYNEKVLDLFSEGETDLQLKRSRADGLLVEGLESHPIGTISDTLGLLITAYQNRTVRDNHINSMSSRSHTIIRLSFVGKENGGARVHTVDCRLGT
jgi:hypothetical protein